MEVKRRMWRNVKVLSQKEEVEIIPVEEKRNLECPGKKRCKEDVPERRTRKE